MWQTLGTLLAEKGGWLAFVALLSWGGWMIATGRLVPRSQNADWRSLALDLMDQLRKTHQTGRVVEKALQALPVDPNERVP